MADQSIGSLNGLKDQELNSLFVDDLTVSDIVVQNNQIIEGDLIVRGDQRLEGNTIISSGNLFINPETYVIEGTGSTGTILMDYIRSGFTAGSNIQIAEGVISSQGSDTWFQELTETGQQYLVNKAGTSPR